MVEKIVAASATDFPPDKSAEVTVRLPSCSGVITRSPAAVITFVSLVSDISS
jgi:hypothetical protein